MTPEEKLDEISHILESRWQETVKSRKGPQKITVSNDAYSNLEAVILELKNIIKNNDDTYPEMLTPDEAQIRTLEDVQMRIAEVMRIVSEYRTNKEDKADDLVAETRSGGASGD